MVMMMMCVCTQTLKLFSCMCYIVLYTSTSESMDTDDWINYHIQNTEQPRKRIEKIYTLIEIYRSAKSIHLQVTRLMPLAVESY
jgi:hypothetical protein